VTVKNAARLITLASIIQTLAYLYALPGHLDEPTWSAHAQFHHVLSWIWIAGLNVAMISLAWGPLQKRKKWAFWALLALFLFAHGGHFLSSFVVPAGRPSEPWYDFAIGAMSSIFAIGLGIGWRALSRQASA